MKKIFFLFLFVLFLNSNVAAAGLGINPALLEFNIASEKDLIKEVEVINNENEKSAFRVYSDSEFIKADPSDFYLEEGQRKKIKIGVIPEKNLKNFEAVLFIVSNSSKNNNIRAGVKMPIEVKILNRGIIKEMEEMPESNGTGKKAENGENNILTGLFSLSPSTQFLSGILLIFFIIAFVIYKKKAKVFKKKK